MEQLIAVPVYGADGSLDKLNFTWVLQYELIATLNFADNFVPTQVRGNEDWVLYSDHLFGDNTGRVVIRNKQGEEWILDGEQPGSFLGEHMWVSSDTPASAGRMLQSIDDETVLVAISS